MLTYTPEAGFTGTDTITYYMKEIENGQENQKVELIITVDNIDNHPPVALVKTIKARVWEKPWYTNSSLKINVLDYFVDADGDVLDIEIIKKPDVNKATANVQNNLNTFVGPNKTIHIYSNVFGALSLIALITGGLLILLVPILKKWMHGVH